MVFVISETLESAYKQLLLLQESYEMNVMLFMMILFELICVSLSGNVACEYKCELAAALNGCKTH